MDICAHMYKFHFNSILLKQKYVRNKVCEKQNETEHNMTPHSELKQHHKAAINSNSSNITKAKNFNAKRTYTNQLLAES